MMFGMPWCTRCRKTRTPSVRIKVPLFDDEVELVELAVCVHCRPLASKENVHAREVRGAHRRPVPRHPWLPPDKP